MRNRLLQPVPLFLRPLAGDALATMQPYALALLAPGAQRMFHKNLQRFLRPHVKPVTMELSLFALFAIKHEIDTSIPRTAFSNSATSCETGNPDLPSSPLTCNPGQMAQDLTGEAHPPTSVAKKPIIGRQGPD